MSARLRRLVLATVVVAVVIMLPWGPAGADAPGPTDYRSQVTAVRPAADGVEVSIAGGDGFLLVEVEPGHTLEAPGYSGEPYVRVRRDGTVQENQASAATELNRSRQGNALDRSYDPAAAPVWRIVASDGRWAWHDHRIHHMGSGVPRGARTDEGLGWEVPLTVDGREIVVSGRLRLLEGPNPLGWLALAAVAAAAATLALPRLLGPLGGAGAALLVAGAAGVVIGVAQRGASPPGAPTPSLVVILPAVTLVAGVIAVMQRGRVLRAVTALAGSAAALGWALLRLSVLWRAVLPTSLDARSDRALTALVLGAGVGAAVAVVRSRALTTPPLTSSTSSPDLSAS